MQRLIFLVMILVTALMLFAIFINWRSRQQYDEKLKLTAVHMKYVCGNCSPELKVLTVNEKKFDFIIRDNIWPVTNELEEDQLCQFINAANDNTTFNETDTGLLFTVAGKLHRYKNLWTRSACSDARSFVVDSIQYGNNGWRKF